MRRPRLGLAVVLCAIFGAAGCEGAPPLPSSGRPADGLLADAELQTVVELGIQRDVDGVVEKRRGYRGKDARQIHAAVVAGPEQVVNARR